VLRDVGGGNGRPVFFYRRKRVFGEGEENFVWVERFFFFFFFVRLKMFGVL